MKENNMRIGPNGNGIWFPRVDLFSSDKLVQIEGSGGQRSTEGNEEKNAQCLDSKKQTKILLLHYNLNRDVKLGSLGKDLKIMKMGEHSTS